MVVVINDFERPLLLRVDWLLTGGFPSLVVDDLDSEVLAFVG